MQQRAVDTFSHSFQNSISTSNNPAGVGNGRLTGSHTQANSGRPSRNAPAGDSIGAPHRHQESAINTSQAYGGAGVPLGSDSNDQRAELGYGNQDTGVGTGPRAAQQALPPRTDASGNPAVPRSRGTLGSRMTGKAESALGSVVGSQSLKEKGLAKERFV